MVIGLIWNVKGLNKPEKLSEVGKLIRDTHADLVGFSESKKDSFLVIKLKFLIQTVISPGSGCRLLVLQVGSWLELSKLTLRLYLWIFYNSLLLA